MKGNIITSHKNYTQKYLRHLSTEVSLEVILKNVSNLDWTDWMYKIVK